MRRLDKEPVFYSSRTTTAKLPPFVMDMEDKAGDGIESLRIDDNDDASNNDSEDGWTKLKKVEDLIMLFGGGASAKQDKCGEPTAEQQEQQVGHGHESNVATTTADPSNEQTKKKPTIVAAADEGTQSQSHSNKIEDFFSRLFNRRQQNAQNLINAACSYGTKIIEAGLDIAHAILSDDEDDLPRHEDNVLFNGYKILVSGRFIHLDCVRRNFESQNQLQVVAKFKKMKRRFLEPQLTLGDRIWCLDFGESAGFIQIQVPSGVNAAEVTYEGPFPEGVVIVNMPPTDEFPKP